MPGTSAPSWNLNDPLKDVDPEMYAIIRKEKSRQIRGLEMIGSENFAPLSVLECMGSCLNNKYSEGRPGKRYYGGNEFIDEMETLSENRALEAYKLDPQDWGVNLQPYSGSSANMELYWGVIGKGGRIMGLDLPDGGHLTHGFQTETRKVSATSDFFESRSYRVDPSTGLIDYGDLEKKAAEFRPNLIIAGASAYPRLIDYQKFREIADKNGSYLVADMAHISGLIAAGLIPSPFPHCHFVTSTVHKTLRGPRAGVIFYRKVVDGPSKPIKMESKIHQAVFPGLQGGPHNHAIAGVGVAMKLANTPEFVEYQKQVLNNAKTLAKILTEFNYTVITGGTDNHLVILNLKPIGLSGSKGEKILEMIGVSVNKNTVPGDGITPSGIRLGTPTLTTRGLGTKDMATVAGFIDEALKIAVVAKTNAGPELKHWNAELKTNHTIAENIKNLKFRVEDFAEKFPIPGFPDL